MREHWELIHDYFAGTLTDEQCRQLESWLQQDDSHVDTFVDEAFLHRQLRDVAAGRKALGASVGNGHDAAGTGPFGMEDGSSASLTSDARIWPAVTGLFVLFLIASVAAVGNYVWGNRHPTAPVSRHEASSPQEDASITAKTDLTRGVATVEPLEPCVWRGASSPDRRRVETGQRLDLMTGTARVSFDCGAVLVLHGPAILRVDSRMDAMLLGGRVSAAVSHEAIGFLLRTVEMDVRDLGTRFDVSVSPDGDTNVQVLDGEVEAHVTHGQGPDQRTVNLLEGEYLRSPGSGRAAPAHGDRFMLFRGIRIGFDKPECLGLLEVRGDDPAHYRLDRQRRMLIADSTWGSVYARQGQGANLFLMPAPSSDDFDVVLSVEKCVPRKLADHIGLVVLDDEDNYARIIYAMGQHKRYVKFNVEQEGVPLQEVENLADFGNHPFSLRLVRQGSTISGWWSTDGQNWTLRDQGEAPAHVRYVGFYVSTGHRVPKEPAPSYQAVIKRFEVESKE